MDGIDDGSGAGEVAPLIEHISESRRNPPDEPNVTGADEIHLFALLEMVRGMRWLIGCGRHLAEELHGVESQLVEVKQGVAVLPGEPNGVGDALLMWQYNGGSGWSGSGGEEQGGEPPQSREAAHLVQ